MIRNGAIRLVLTKISFQKEKPRKSFRCERWKIESNRRLNTVKLWRTGGEEESGGEHCNNNYPVFAALRSTISQELTKKWPTSETAEMKPSRISSGVVVCVDMLYIGNM